MTVPDKSVKIKKNGALRRRRARALLELGAQTNGPKHADIEAIYGFYPGPIAAVHAIGELKAIGFQGSDISVSPIATEQSLIEAPRESSQYDSIAAAAARIAGGMLAVVSIPLTAPILMALGGLGTRNPSQSEAPLILRVKVANGRNAAKIAAEVLERSGGKKISFSGQYGLGLARRQYRDKNGKVHHHTQTYECAPEELSTSRA